ncbi:unnamed protein product [Protopolystoma xenopodis]|uniref:Uncharacterized protein n=1 Tax=Protopolystoma xenopodis TaxID=117903 RepID=A0A448X797_9PLAT|nr:unnamed protein product [Protopolystoma xenopodis]
MRDSGQVGGDGCCKTRTQETGFRTVVSAEWEASPAQPSPAQPSPVQSGQVQLSLASLDGQNEASLGIPTKEQSCCELITL